MLVPRPESELLVEAALDLPEGARVHDVGTGSGAIALALLDERPDLRVTRVGAVARGGGPRARERGAARAAARGGGGRRPAAGRLRPRDREPPVRARRPSGTRLMPEITRYEPRVAITGGDGRARLIRELVAGDPARARAWRSSTREDQGDAIRELLDDADLLPRPRGLGPHHRRPRAVTPEDVETFERCISVGGVAIFPADTVYGLATEPDSREGVDRLYRLKGRAPDKPAAVMFFQLELGARGAARARRRARAARSSGSCPGADARCCRTPRGASRSRAGRSRSGSACACRRSRASSRRSARCAGRCCSRAPTAPAGRTRAAWRTWTPGVRAGVDLVLDARRAARHAVDRRGPHRATRTTGDFEVAARGACCYRVEAVLRSLR